MARHYNSFKFVGNLSTPKDKTKLYTVKKFDSGWERHSLLIGVQESRTNSMFLEAGCMYKPTEDSTIYTFGKDGAKLEIPFTDRLNPSVLAMVADYKKFIVDLTKDEALKDEYIKLSYKIRELEKKEALNDEDKKKLNGYKDEYVLKTKDRHEFICEYDFINFIKDNIEEVKQHRVKVLGNKEMSEYNGNYYTKYIPTSLEFAGEDEINSLSAKIDIYFEKNSVDESIFKDTKKILIDGYLLNYDKNAGGDRYFPKQFVINAEKIDFENEAQVAMFNVIKNEFVISKKTFHHILCDVSIYKGAEVKEFGIENLTKKQATFVQLGINKIEDFRPRGGNVLGNNIEEVRIFKPLLINEFKEGAIDTGLKEDDFRQLVSISSADKTVAEVKQDNKIEQPSQATEDPFKGLFG